MNKHYVTFPHKQTKLVAEVLSFNQGTNELLVKCYDKTYLLKINYTDSVGIRLLGFKYDIDIHPKSVIELGILGKELYG